MGREIALASGTPGGLVKLEVENPNRARGKVRGGLTGTQPGRSLEIGRSVTTAKGGITGNSAILTEGDGQRNRSGFGDARRTGEIGASQSNDPDWAD